MDLYSVLMLRGFVLNRPWFTLEQGCQTQIHSGPKLSNEVKSRAKLKIH